MRVPEAVYRELSVKEESACKRAVDSSLDWIRVDEIKNQMAKAMYKTQLHDGEVEVMILAKEIALKYRDLEGVTGFPKETFLQIRQ